MSWLDRIEERKFSKYSQGHQDGIIQAIFERIGTTNKFCVEFGFNSTSLTGGSGANTARLVIDDGWSAIFYDADHVNLDINLHKIRLTQENIGSAFLYYNVPREPDYVSIDVDGDDLWLMKGMLESGYRPRLISVEYNARFPITESITVKPDCPKWDYDAAYGASLLALYTVGKEFGYGIVAVESGLDLFFVRDDLGLRAMTLEELKPYTDIHVHTVPTKERQALFVQYPSLEPVREHPWFNGTA